MFWKTPWQLLHNHFQFKWHCLGCCKLGQIPGLWTHDGICQRTRENGYHLSSVIETELLFFFSNKCWITKRCLYWKFPVNFVKICTSMKRIHPGAKFQACPLYVGAHLSSRQHHHCSSFSAWRDALRRKMRRYDPILPHLMLQAVCELASWTPRARPI